MPVTIRPMAIQDVADTVKDGGTFMFVVTGGGNIVDIAN